MGNYGYGAPASQEPVFFQAQGAYVSRSRVVLNGVTFPINGITAVYSRTIPKSILGMVLGVLFILGGLSCCAIGVASGDSNAIVGCGGFGVVDFLIGAGLVALYLWVQKIRYVLVIGTAGREISAIVHTDWRYVGSIVDAINNALASRM